MTFLRADPFLQDYRFPVRQQCCMLVPKLRVRRPRFLLRLAASELDAPTFTSACARGLGFYAGNACTGYTLADASLDRSTTRVAFWIVCAGRPLPRDA
jgi:hypothetical protein